MIYQIIICIILFVFFVFAYNSRHYKINDNIYYRIKSHFSYRKQETLYRVIIYTIVPYEEKIIYKSPYFDNRISAEQYGKCMVENFKSFNKEFKKNLK